MNQQQRKELFDDWMKEQSRIDLFETYEAGYNLCQKEVDRLKGLLEDVCRQMLKYKHTPVAGFKLPEILNLEIEEGLRQFKLSNNIQP